MTLPSAHPAPRLMRLATYAAVGLAVVLALVKAIAWQATGSVAVLSSLVDSLLDAAASLINLFAIRQALEPADAEHRFGHGKAEPLAALGQAAFIAGSGLLVVLQAVGNLLQPRPLHNAGIGLAIMLFSIVATFALVRFQAYVVRRSDSVAIRADRLHYAGDVMMNGSVILALMLTDWLDIYWVDPLCGIAIAGYMLWGSVSIARIALDMLMDRELSDAVRQQIIAIVKAHPEVRAVHDLRTRASGPRQFIQLHMVLPAELTLSRAHVISDEVEAELQSAFPGAEILIHQDPTDAMEPEIRA
ncbi:MAG: cation diffusion facilitator family transporter [Alphaproteobacteria bacterium]|nr:cation diffusion facilitator family transporter [Alphaproteobacteria bacterium]